ncbi:sulfite exporter TauE/SafE [Desulfosporosinus acididurans]|uniref:Probable membrane transporter protein n=1 Tax=Desulfosporosinus acididurans TaxID=476652 RepID=A0A0J1FQS3_9FIRM|nr:sulfite exporter TauE/SafE family protein [Desulfosporosinus acididurans]KLU65855.1 sulfite exporter TauE/SafE [Desulfosporosinus acididurans]
MSILLILAVISVVFLGALTRTTFGFGEAVISMPLLTLLPISLHTAVSLMGFVGLTAALLAVITGWRHIDTTSLLPLVFAALVGIPVGLFMVTFVPVKAITGLLGAVLITYGIYSIRQSRVALQNTLSMKIHSRWGLLFGFFSGVFGSAYNFNGVPVAIYGSLRKWHPDKFRSTMQAYFFISGALIVAGQGIGGFWTSDVFTLFGLSLPAILAATIVGTMIHRHIPTAKFQRYVFFLITALGTVLLVKSFIS